MNVHERISVAAFQLSNNGQIFIINHCLTGPDSEAVKRGLLERAKQSPVLYQRLARVGFLAKWTAAPVANAAPRSAVS